MDADKSGYVDYREFCRAAYDRKMLLVDQNLEYAFKAIDEDKSGQIDRKEIAKAFKGCELDGEVDTNAMIATCDADDDKLISLEEFKQSLKQLIAPSSDGN